MESFHNLPRQQIRSERVAQSFDQLKRDTLLDAGYVQELQSEVGDVGSTYRFRLEY